MRSRTMQHIWQVQLFLLIISILLLLIFLFYISIFIPLFFCVCLLLILIYIFLAFIVCIYLVIALFFDIYAYLKPLQKVTLSAKQQQMLDWPPNYPPDLIGIPLLLYPPAPSLRLSFIFLSYRYV